MKYPRIGAREEENERHSLLDEDLEADAISEEWYWLQMSDEEL